MNILITGGTGFVGQHLVKQLNKKHNIIVIGRKSCELKQKNVNYFNNCDITKYETIQKYFKNIDIVFNLAGYISFKQKDRKNLIKINFNGALNVLRACEKYNVKKLIHLSSTAVFGFSDKIINENFKFDWSRHKKLVYSYSKFLPEKKLLSSKINVVILNPPTILGPGDEKILVLFRKIKNGLVFVSSGRNSFIDVRDVVNGLILLMKTKVQNRKYIVIGDNNSFYDFNNLVANLLQSKKPRYIIAKPIGFILSKFVLMFDKYIKNVGYENIFFAFKDRVHDDSKIRRLGYKPKYNIKQSLKDSIDYLGNLI